MKYNRKCKLTGLYVVIFLMAMTGCRKAERSECLHPARRIQSLMVQTQSDQTSRRTFPIDMGEARTKSSYELWVPSTENSSVDSLMASRIFQDILQQGESLWGRYFLDGQYAYANNIRRYVEQTYHISCQKLFVFGELTAVSPRYDCCASWKYDVACVIRGKGGIIYVFDPKLFTGVTTQDVWINHHLYPTACVPQPRLTSQALVAGESFTPLDAIPSGYLVDGDYTYTNIMVGYYSDSVGCHCNLQ